MKGTLPNQDQTNLLRNRLTSLIRLEHELRRLAEEIDWARIDLELVKYYAREGLTIPMPTESSKYCPPTWPCTMKTMLGSVYSLSVGG